MPAKSKDQAIAAAIALAAKRDPSKKKDLKGASKQMHEGMSESQLKHYTKTEKKAFSWPWQREPVVPQFATAMSVPNTPTTGVQPIAQAPRQVVPRTPVNTRAPLMVNAGGVQIPAVTRQQLDQSHNIMRKTDPMIEKMKNSPSALRHPAYERFRKMLMKPPMDLSEQRARAGLNPYLQQPQIPQTTQTPEFMQSRQVPINPQGIGDASRRWGQFVETSNESAKNRPYNPYWGNMSSGQKYTPTIQVIKGEAQADYNARKAQMEAAQAQLIKDTMSPKRLEYMQAKGFKPNKDRLIIGNAGEALGTTDRYIPLNRIAAAPGTISYRDEYGNIKYFTGGPTQDRAEATAQNRALMPTELANIDKTTAQAEQDLARLKREYLSGGMLGLGERDPNKFQVAQQAYLQSHPGAAEALNLKAKEKGLSTQQIIDAINALPSETPQKEKPKKPDEAKQESKSVEEKKEDTKPATESEKEHKAESTTEDSFIDGVIKVANLHNLNKLSMLKLAKLVSIVTGKTDTGMYNRFLERIAG